jgi:pyruvate,water dikinase
METLNLFRDAYRKWKGRRRDEEPEISEIFRFRYTCFRDLLDSNAQLLDIISDMESKLQGNETFGFSYVRTQATRAAFHVFRMVKSLDVLSGHKYRELYDVVDRINHRIQEAIGQRREIQVPELVIPFPRVCGEMVDSVGGKSANLGEIVSRVNLQVPAGFAITTRSFALFMKHNDLSDEISKKKMEIDPREPETIERTSREIRELILEAEVPPEVAEAILGAYQGVAAPGSSRGPLVSLRSSAIGEDSELSYAGQYLSLLNLSVDRILPAYKEIVASLYSEAAIAYRLNKGILVEDAAMGVACMEMIRSVSGGVIYSRNPFNPTETHILITAVWGLGSYAVDGTITPDTYTVARDPDKTILRKQVSNKPVQLDSDPEGGLRQVPVDPERQDHPCLTDEQIRVLADYALRLEEHFQCAQDTEWALDEQGRLFVLQSRPLQVRRTRPDILRAVPPIIGHRVLIEGGSVASEGVGCGPAFHVRSDADLSHFPDGGVLVAKHSSPKFVLVMPRAQAIVTDAGSVAGHMAAVAREFSVPCIVGAAAATSVIPSGAQVTVDALSGRVYEGRVAELVALQGPKVSTLLDTPVHRALKRVAEFVVPLHLLDPKSPDFHARSCRSLHDLGRLVHEMSYGEMFKVSDLVTDHGQGAVKLEAPLPLDLYLIDLLDGLSGPPARNNRVTLENIASTPLKALLEGITDEDLRGREPRPVQLSGFFSVMREQMLSPPRPTERFGEKSYAIISGKYLNFSSRVGYHYCVVDAYCGKTVNKNYITFSFKGGAADEIRRNRRVRAIAGILAALDFSVEVKADRVDARFQKRDAPATARRLEAIGRLLNFTRQMDMLMVSEASVEAIARNFLEGNYRLEANRRPASSTPGSPAD